MQVIELARSGTRVAQLAATFGMSEATIYNWLKQEQIDRGEIDGFSTDQALELTAAKRHRARCGAGRPRGGRPTAGRWRSDAAASCFDCRRDRPCGSAAGSGRSAVRR